MKRIVLLGLGLALGGLLACSPSILPQENAQVQVDHTPPPEFEVTSGPPPALPPLPPCGDVSAYESPVVRPVPTGYHVEPTKTPLPNRGVYVGEVKPVAPLVNQLAGQESLCLDHMIGFDIEGDILVGTLRVADGVYVISLNLETGVVQQISQFLNEGYSTPIISGHYVVWTESAPDLGQDKSRLQLFDLEQKQLSTLYEKEYSFSFLDFKENLIIWRERDLQTWDIHGYDLITRQPVVIDDSDSIKTFLHVCSDEWLIYLQQEAGWPSSANLYAYHRPSQALVLIGQVPFFKSAVSGQQHQCDGPYVTWVSNVQEETTLQKWDTAFGQFESYSRQSYKQHLYDLTTRTDRTLDITPGLPLKVRLDGDILIGTTGYDLQRDVPFDITPPGLPPAQRPNITLRLAGQRLVWQAGHSNGSSKLFMAFIIQD